MKIIRFAIVIIGLGIGNAGAANFSFIGNFSSGNEVQEINFTVASESRVTWRSFGFEGGTNAAGTTLPGDGFDSIISLFNASTGDLITYDNGPDPSLDPLRILTLAPGNYIAALTVWSSYPNGSSLADGFRGAGPIDFLGRDHSHSQWAVDILNVENASLGASYISPSPIPEPQTYAMLLAGLGLIGFIARRKKQVL
jgi:hypothetical protein